MTLVQRRASDEPWEALRTSASLTSSIANWLKVGAERSRKCPRLPRVQMFPGEVTSRRAMA